MAGDATKLSERILRVVHAFNSGDDRRDDIRELARDAAALERALDETLEVMGNAHKNQPQVEEAIAWMKTDRAKLKMSLSTAQADLDTARAQLDSLQREHEALHQRAEVWRETAERLGREVAAAERVIEEARWLYQSMRDGFVRCERCGDQTNTGDCDFVASTGEAFAAYDAARAAQEPKG